MTNTSFSEPELTFTDVDGHRIAIRHREAEAGRATVLFLPGYASDMAGLKALAIDRFCAARGLGCLRLDYSGTGLSDGEFANGTLDRWLGEVLAAIDHAALHGPLVIAGSSMGGWIALHAALRRPARVAAMLGIAAAPDFTEWGFTTDEKAALERDGRIELMRPDGSLSLRTQAFWQSGQSMRLLDGPISLPIPVRLVHGTADGAVPADVALRLLDRLDSPNLQLRLIKGAGHNLSEPRELDIILADLHDLVAMVDLSSPRTTSQATDHLKDST
jgi:pimeloyl-ACP methyl ester carboxylesterase